MNNQEIYRGYGKYKTINISLSTLAISLLFFYFMHPFVLKLNILGLNVTKIGEYFAAYIFPALYLLFNYRYTNMFVGKILNRHRKYVYGFILLFIWTVISMAINNSNDFGFFTNFLVILRKMLAYMVLSIVILKLKKPGSFNILDNFIHYYIISDVMNVISTLVLVFFPQIKAVWFSKINMTAMNYELTEAYAYKNRICISGFSGFGNTLSCTISIILCLYIITNKQKNIIKYIVYIGICLIGNFFYGRIGLGISVICLLFYLVYYRKIKMKYLLTTLIVSFLIVLGGKHLMSINESFNATLTWATKPFINFFKTGSMDDRSFNIMMSMRFMPETKTFFIGDGRHNNSDGTYYMNTDLGFMRTILQGGIILCIIIYSMVLSGIIDFGKNKMYFFISMLITTVAFEFKGEVWHFILPLLITCSLLFELPTENDSSKRLVCRKT